MSEITELWNRGFKEFWNPLEINFKEDVKDWREFSEDQRKYLTDLIYHQLFGEYEVMIGVARLSIIIEDFNARMFLLTHVRDNTVHSNIFERFLKEVGENKISKEKFANRTSKSYFELAYVKPRKILEDLEKGMDLEKLASFMSLYYLALDGILYNTSFIALDQLIFSRGKLRGLGEAYKRINIDEKRQTMFCAYFLRDLSKENPNIIKAIEETLEEASPLILSTIYYFSSLAESFGRNIDEFAKISQGVIDEELSIIGLRK